MSKLDWVNPVTYFRLMGYNDALNETGKGKTI